MDQPGTSPGLDEIDGLHHVGAEIFSAALDAMSADEIAAIIGPMMPDAFAVAGVTPNP